MKVTLYNQVSMAGFLTLWGQHRSEEEQSPILHPLRLVSMRGEAASNLERGIQETQLGNLAEKSN